MNYSVNNGEYDLSISPSSYCTTATAYLNREYIELNKWGRFDSNKSYNKLGSLKCNTRYCTYKNLYDSNDKEDIQSLNTILNHHNIDKEQFLEVCDLLEEYIKYEECGFCG